jgi:hypothetical protein
VEAMTDPIYEFHDESTVHRVCNGLLVSGCNQTLIVSHLPTAIMRLLNEPSGSGRLHIQHFSNSNRFDCLLVNILGNLRRYLDVIKLTYLMYSTCISCAWPVRAFLSRQAGAWRARVPHTAPTAQKPPSESLKSGGSLTNVSAVGDQRGDGSGNGTCSSEKPAWPNVRFLNTSAGDCPSHSSYITTTLVLVPRLGVLDPFFPCATWVLF